MVEMGQKIGKLLVLRQVKKDNDKHTFVECQCECGNIVIKRKDQLNKNSSCGCYTSKLRSKISTKHGLHQSNLYDRYYSMRHRCYNPNNQYYCNYGGRGIKICDEWLEDFKNFYNWAINNGYKKNLTIDRIDVNGDYTPDNCRWVPKQEQDWNRRNNRNFTWRGETHCLSEWSRILNMSRDCLYHRLIRKKWDVKKAFTTPMKNKK